MDQIVKSPLFNTVFAALESPDSFESAVECIVAMIRETKDVDGTRETIQRLAPRVMQLRFKIAEAREAEDSEVFKGLARLFAEAGEAWVVLLAREPAAFKPVVEALVEIAAKDWEKEAIGYTFGFWEDLKLYMDLDKFAEAKALYEPLYSQLVDYMIHHLQYPQPEGGDETDLFDGDREQEDRFRDYRHAMGDVLKDCCDVLGVEACLVRPYNLIEAWIATHGASTTATRIPQWQQLEAPVFALRALGAVVPSDENVMLPRLMPLIIQIPDQEKLRYQVIMTLGRYSEWTARHPATLQPQLDFIMAAFNHPSQEVVRGAANAFNHVCQDCADILKGFFPQIHQFYVSVLNKLPEPGQIEVTEAIASIVTRLDMADLYEGLKKGCEPIVQRVMTLANKATDEPTKLELSGMIRALKQCT
jgi:transportin-3